VGDFNMILNKFLSLGTWRRRPLFAVGALALVLGLAACGGRQFMPPGQLPADDAGAVQGQILVPTPSVPERTDLRGSAGVPALGEGAHPRVIALHQLGGSTRRGPGKVTKVTVRHGDTWWKIAERKDVYGSGWLYPLIYKANRALVAHPADLRAGMVLRVPRDVPDPDVEKAEEEAMTGQFVDQSPLPLAQNLSEAPSPQPTSMPTPTVQPTIQPTPVPTPEPAAPPQPKLGFGRVGWFLLLLLLAILGLLTWMVLRRDEA
jgi:hypothetical protein